MSVQPIQIPPDPSLSQMQAIQFEVTKRMNVFIEMVAVEVEQIGTPEFVFAGINARLSLPTLDGRIREIAEEKERVKSVD